MIRELDSSDELEEALAAIAARLGELGDAKERLRSATERRASAKRTGRDRHAENALPRSEKDVDAAKERLRADRAVRVDAIGAAGRCSRDAGRKARRKSQREGGEWWERFVDYRQIITATPQRPGTRRLFLNIEELASPCCDKLIAVIVRQRRYPGAWEKRRD